MESLICAQTELSGRIARTNDNIRKAGATKLTQGLVQSTLKLLDKKWEKFEDQHDQLRSRFQVELQSHDYARSNFLGQVEEIYLQQRSLLLELLQAPSAKGSAVDGAHSNTFEGHSSRAALPRIQLPQFTGKYSDWPAFRDLFHSLVVADGALTEVEKLHYLKSCVKGDAEQLIRNLAITSDNFERAWATLTGHYENTRVLVTSFLNSFLAILRMRSESAADLRKIFHGMLSTVGSLEGVGRPISNSNDLFVHIVVELLDGRTRREWENHVGGSVIPPAYDELFKFLERKLRTLEALTAGKSEHGSQRHESSVRVVRALHAKPREPDRGRCPLCRRRHYVMFCEKYKTRTAAERKDVVDRHSLCPNCLGKHSVSSCNSEKTCSRCSERHHSSLHDAYQLVHSERADCESSAAALVAHHPPRALGGRLLATARVRVADRFGTLHLARVLLDPGSEVSLISEALAQRLRLPRVSSSLSILGIGGVTTGSARGRVEVTILTRLGALVMSVEAYVLPRLTSYGQRYCVSGHSWPHLRDLDLADPDFLRRGTVDLILGTAAFSYLVQDGVRKGGPGEPIALRTLLGWVVLGESSCGTSVSSVSALQSSVDDELSACVRRFWEQEEAPRGPAPLTRVERECLDHFEVTHSRQPDGRYLVRLPLKENLPNLSDTRRSAERMLTTVERRFVRDPTFKHSYTDFMREYEALGHMTVATQPERGKVKRLCYLPHHGVVRESTNRLRVVFNGSQRTREGLSLNDALLVGPNLLPRLADVLLSWRRHRFVIAADVEKMYRQISVHPDDRDLQRILWRSGNEVLEFRLNTVTYGLASAPFLAIRTLQQLASDEEARFPGGAAILRDDVYMDDVLTGASSRSEVLLLREQLRGICSAGGFPLRKWTANEAQLLEGIPDEHRRCGGPRSLRERGTTQSTLGLEWDPRGDLFSFVIRQGGESATTKRGVLSQASQLFDPLGWMSPVTIRAKCIIQSTWLRRAAWDDRLPEDDVAAWRAFHRELPQLLHLRIPRWVGLGRVGCAAEIHGFSDASERAYAAALYLRTSVGSEVRVTLMTAKTKVAPLHQVSLPRLELCAAILLVRLAAHSVEVLRMPSSMVHLWTDSTVVLCWIQGHPRQWTTFVANRVAEIQRTLPDATWHHVPGKCNPADCASRGIAPSELPTHELWWNGPDFLLSPQWSPTVDVNTPLNMPERRKVALVAEIGAVESEVLLRFSARTRLLRVSAWMRRWRLKCQGRHLPSAFLSPEELREAELLWIRHVQSVAFGEELRALTAGRAVSGRSPLLRLTPFKDAGGLLRVGGRLKHALLCYDERHPIILPPHSHLTRLIIDAVHRQVLHGGFQLVVATLRQRYWVPRARLLVKQHIYRCPPCVRWRAASPRPLMSGLPESRVTPCRPFMKTGVDYAGPVSLRSARGRGHSASKAFIAVFVCFISRAVHLEVVSDYSTDAFLAAYRRFSSRRGVCSDLYSDCGTNFVGADKQLRALFRASAPSARELADRLASKGTRWHFNPPGAPHFGGLWEAAVKSVKHHLRRVIGSATLTFEEMTTLLAQVEACLNSRPLRALTDDPDDVAALTPGHFLVGAPLCAIAEPTLEDAPEGRLDRWQRVQQMRDHLWLRWSQEYLTGLTRRSKWCRAGTALQVGQLCLIRSEAAPPCKWPLGRITALHPGDGGEVRVATIRTATNTLTRPLVKIVPLPPATEGLEQHKACQGLARM